MKKTKIFWHLLDLIFLIVFNLYFFLLKGIEQPTSVWISYGSVHFSYFMFLLIPAFVRKGSNSADYGRPLIFLTTGYFILSLIVGVVFIALSSENTSVVLLAQVTVAALFAVLLFANLIANEHTADLILIHEAELKYVKESSSRLDALLKQISDASIRKKVTTAYDLIHCSQFKSHSNVKSLELSVRGEIDNLEEALMQNNFETIHLIVEKMCKLASERNRQLRLLN